MTTYAESIMRSSAEIEISQMTVPYLHHLDYVKDEVAAGRYTEHKTYAMDGSAKLDKSFRDSKTVLPLDDVTLVLEIFSRVQIYAQRHFDIDPADAIAPASLELFAYPPGIGIKAHVDDHVMSPISGKLIAEDPQRGITTILYLNNDFEGGEIVFPKQGKVIKPEPGLFVIFPSNQHFPHEVRPITSGMRFSYQRMFSVMNGKTNLLTI